MAKKQAKANSRPSVSTLLPPEVLAFLEEHGKKKLTFDPEKHPDMEVREVVFKASRSLKRSKFNLCTHEYYLNQGESGDDPNLEYMLEGVDLIAASDDYDPEGILVWFPQLDEFGFWDPDHAVIGLFPKTPWAKIEKRLPQYINAQWNDSPKHKLLRPWADRRCAELKGKLMR